MLRKVGQHVKLVIARLVTDESNVDAAPKEEVQCNSDCNYLLIHVMAGFRLVHVAASTQCTL